MKTDSGIVQTRGRGVLKKDNAMLMVGDNVEFEMLDDGDGVIDRVGDGLEEVGALDDMALLPALRGACAVERDTIDSIAARA